MAFLGFRAEDRSVPRMLQLYAMSYGMLVGYMHVLDDEAEALRLRSARPYDGEMTISSTH